MNNIISQEEKNRIDALCKEYYIENYTINNDGTIDVDGNVYLSNYKLDALPITFGKVTGNFKCSNNLLTTLHGSPTEVGGTFDCSRNKLTSVEYSPDKVGSDFVCEDNELKNLKGCSNEIIGDIWIKANKINTLEFFPKKLGGYMFSYSNKLPIIFENAFMGLGNSESETFLQYQNYYDVWTPEFSEENMQLLIDEIKDGLI
jgi:hypothetical protein